MVLCSGPPNAVQTGSGSLFIENMAAGMGDQTFHGGQIFTGCPTVFIGGAPMTLHGRRMSVLGESDTGFAS
jgi:uncharacterized Zn-binding protein involved in type VI secretion